MKILKHDLIRTVVSLGDKFDNSGFSLYQTQVLKINKCILLTAKVVKYWIRLSRIVGGSSSQASLNLKLDALLKEQNWFWLIKELVEASFLDV